MAEIIIYDDNNDVYLTLKGMLADLHHEDVVRGDLDDPIGSLKSVIGAGLKIAFVDRSWEGGWGHQGEHFIREAKIIAPSIIFIGMSGTEKPEFGDKYIWKGDLIDEKLAQLIA